MKLLPLHDWAVIRPSAADEVTTGGLYVPDTAREKPHEGVVEAIGPGAYEEEERNKKYGEKVERRFIATTIKPGDTVLYEQYAGRTYKIGDEDRVLVRERDILGILSDRLPRRQEAIKPLQIPAVTSTKATTTLVKRSPTAVIVKAPANVPVIQKTETKTSRKLPIKSVAKKKAVKKAAKKVVEKKITKAKKPSKAKITKAGKQAKRRK